MAMIFVDTQQPRQAETILIKDTPILIGQFITRGSSSKPYSKTILCKAAGITFTPIKIPNIAPSDESNKNPDVIDHRIVFEVIPIDLKIP